MHGRSDMAMKRIPCPSCNQRLFNCEVEIKVAIYSNSYGKTADLLLRCNCGKKIAVRFPRNANPDICLAKGTIAQSKEYSDIR